MVKAAKLIFPIILLLVVLTACSGEPASEFEGQASFNLEATPGRHYATYTRFIGTYVYRIQLTDGEYSFSFVGSPGLQFALKDRRGNNLIELAPGETGTLAAKRDTYFLSVTNRTPGSGLFDIRWEK
ncbi:MAG: hypothetical protein KGZ66_01950 [Selenomonadales bacterium]|jgi:hypothetical protein|nr:hypothetical protein [Selenomonadales bacterium]